MGPKIRKTTKDTAPEELTIGEEILEEIVEASDEKHRKIMKQHLKYCLRKVDDLKESKAHVDEKLEDASEDLQRVTKMTLAEFAIYIKEKDLYDVESNRTVGDNERIIRSKLKMTFNSYKE